MENKDYTNVDSNILFIGPIDDNGGIGSVIKLYKSQFKEAKYISTYPGGVKRNKLIVFIRSLSKIIKYIETDKNIRILHIHCASKGSFYRKSIVLLIGKWKKKKIIMHMHGGGFKDFYSKNHLNKIYIRSILSLSDKVICLSEEWNKFYSVDMKLKNVFVLGNAIELRDISNHGIVDGKIKLLFMGKICIEKGIFDLIHFLSTNRKFLEGKIKLAICGVDEEHKIDELKSKNYWGKHIDFHGWIEGKRKNELIKECDIYILPSHFEGVPISILEAMAYGKPIIATNVGGIPSLVKNEYNGWIIEPFELNKLNSIFDDIFSQPHLLEKLGKNSFLVAQEYDPMKMFERLKNLYNELINNNNINKII